MWHWRTPDAWAGCGLASSAPARQPAAVSRPAARAGPNLPLAAVLWNGGISFGIFYVIMALAGWTLRTA